LKPSKTLGFVFDLVLFTGIQHIFCVANTKSNFKGMKRAIYLIIPLSFALCAAMSFTPPNQEETLRAIGNTKDLPIALQRALDPGNDFKTMPVPNSGDWLAEHFEPGQSFDNFASIAPAKPNRHRNKIYLQPLGDFIDGQSPSLEKLRTYTASYFMMDAKILPVLPIMGSKLTTRRNPYTRNRQILTGDVLLLLKKRWPPDAFCVLAVTMEDLYPDPSWNFVFGQASHQDRVGVFSFSRYDPMIYGEKRRKNFQEVLLRRNCKVLAHETGHMFSLAHCTYFQCVMNGSNHLQESDARPLSLCPVCLHKLQYAIEFDVVDRYQKLLDFYKRVDFETEAEWVSKRLNRILN
jgi:archaemetzincin